MGYATVASKVGVSRFAPCGGDDSGPASALLWRMDAGFVFARDVAAVHLCFINQVLECSSSFEHGKVTSDPTPERAAPRPHRKGI